MRSRGNLRPLWPLLAGLLALVLLGWVLGAVSRASFTPSDLDAVRDVAAGRSSALVGVAHALSALASGFVVAPLAVAICGTLYWRGRRTAAIAIALSALGASMISNVDKLLVGRPRPPVGHLEAVSTASFPSGHSTTAAAFYLALVLALSAVGTKRALALSAAALLAAGVALSRVYLGVHYPSDVLGGLLLGAAWSLLVSAVIWRRGVGTSRRRGPDPAP